MGGTESLIKIYTQMSQGYRNTEGRSVGDRRYISTYWLEEITVAGGIWLREIETQTGTVFNRKISVKLQKASFLVSKVLYMNFRL